MWPAKFLTPLVVGLTNTLIPPACLVCHTALPGDDSLFGLGNRLCEPCLELWKAPVGPQCRRCAAPVGPFIDTAKGCTYCREDVFTFEHVLRIGIYRGHLESAVLRAKFGADVPLVSALAEVWWREHEPFLNQQPYTALVAVPRYGFWTRWQSPSLADQLAERWSIALGVQVARWSLRKNRATPRQAGSSMTDRRKQQRGAFSAAPKLTGRWLLVDDVLTSGATASAAASALRRSGAEAVDVAVLARGIGTAPHLPGILPRADTP